MFSAFFRFYFFRLVFALLRVVSHKRTNQSKNTQLEMIR